MERDARVCPRPASIWSIVSFLLCLSAPLAFAAPPLGDASPPSSPIKDVAELIESKRVQIAALEEEISTLQLQLPSEPIEIQLKLYEVNTTKLRHIGVDFAAVANGAVYTQGKSTVPITGDASAKLLEAWKQTNIAKLFSDDTLTLTCGEPFTLKKGVEFSMPMSPDGKESRKVFEKEIIVTATPQANGAFRVALVPLQSCADRFVVFGY